MKQKSVFLMIAVLFGLRIATTAQTIPSYVPTNGLVGWWPFNGNANDESGNGNNGTVNGATLTEDRFGNGNAAYGFDGVDDNIIVNDDATLRPEQITISAWLNSSNESSNQIIYKGDWSDASNEQYSVNSSFHFGIKSQSNCIAGIGWISCNEQNTFNPSEWHHVVAKYDGNFLKLYLDCILIDSTAHEGVIDSCIGGELIFGSSWGQIPYYFNGQIDDIGIWNRALSEEEISILCQANLCCEYITVTDTLIINLNPTGFNPVTYDNTILMYPNPSSEQLTINYGDFASLAGYTLKIFNSIGQEIHSANINQQQEVLQLGTWGGAGTYQVVIYNAQGVPVDTRTIVLH